MSQLAMHWPLLLVAIYVGLLPVLATNVALCFFGLTRSLDLTISNIRSSVLDPLLMADMNVSVYLHTYDLEAISNPRSAESQAALTGQHISYYSQTSCRLIVQMLQREGCSSQVWQSGLDMGTPGKKLMCTQHSGTC